MAGPKFSLRYKFLLLTSTLLVLSVLVHLFLATQIFRDDKTALVFDLNKSLVTSLENDLSHKLETAFGKMSLLALANRGKGLSVSQSRELIGSDASLVFIGVATPDSQVLDLYVRNSFLETYSLKKEDLAALIKSSKRFATDKSSGQYLWRIDGKVPMMGLARVVIEEDELGRKISQSFVVGLLDLSEIIKSLNTTQTAESFVLNRDGELLAQSHPNLTLSQKSELVQKGLRSPVETMVLSFEDSSRKLLGAFAKGEDIIVVAQTDEAKVMAVVHQLIKRSVLFGIMVICSAFLMILFFSKSITRPLDILISGMERVSSGDLNTQLDIKSNDEISILSNSFNEMIRDLKVSRDQLEEINRDLEQKVADRTRKLEEQNRAVKEAQEALLRTTRLASVGEIAGRAAHEVLNPLTGILTRLEKVQRRLTDSILSETQLLNQIREAWEKDYTDGGFEKLLSVWKSKSQINPDQTLWDEDLHNIKNTSDSLEKETHHLVEDAKFLVSESQRINRIVGQMRSLSHTKREQREESAHHLLSEASKIMADLFDRDGAKIVEEFQAQNDSVAINRDEFLQVVTNLLRNSLQAIRQTEMRKGIVKVKTREEANKLVIEIEDNGIGIEEKDKAKLFNHNFSTKDPSEGTGLGLSISRRFIRGFDGDLALDKSEFGKGTTFRITLPLAVPVEYRGYGT